MASGSTLEAKRATSVQALVERLGPHATKVMVGAAAVGVVAAFLPAVSMTLTFLGTTTSESVGVWRDWRGKLDLLAYLGVGVIAVTMIRKPNAPAGKKLALASLIAAGVAVLAAVWLPLSVRGGIDIPNDLGSISIGFGCYLNVLAALALAAGSALQAKRANVF
jgi:hypothetical protein